MGLIAQQYPHLVAVDIDDFSSNVGAAFTGNTGGRTLTITPTLIAIQN